MYANITSVVFQKNEGLNMLRLFSLVLIMLCSYTYGEDFSIYPQTPTIPNVLRHSSDSPQIYHLVNYQTNDTLRTFMYPYKILFSVGGTFLLTITGEEWDETYSVYTNNGELFGSWSTDDLDDCYADLIAVSEVDGDLMFFNEWAGTIQFFDVQTKTKTEYHLGGKGYENFAFISKISLDGKSLIITIQVDDGRRISKAGACVIKYDILSGKEIWRQTFEEQLGPEDKSLSVNRTFISFTGKFLFASGYVKQKTPYQHRNEGYIGYLLDQAGNVIQEYRGLNVTSGVKFDESENKIFLRASNSPLRGDFIINTVSGEISE